MIESAGMLHGAARLLLLAALLALPPFIAMRGAAEEERADLVFVSGPEPETLDPALATAVLEIRLLAALFEGLAEIEPATLEPRFTPSVATVTARERGWALRLRDDLAWSDGSPLAADDFLYAWRRALEPSTRAPLADAAALVAREARAEGERTIVLGLERPLAEVLRLLVLPVFFPVPRRAVEAWGEAWTRPEHMVSNGPFRLEAHEPGRRLRLVRNERYHGARSVGLGSIEAIITSSATVGDATAFQIYETGGADLAFTAPQGAARRLSGRGDFHLRSALSTAFLRFNCTRAPLADPRVRRALSAAVPRDAIARRVLRNGELAAFSLVPPGMPGYERPRLDRLPPGEPPPRPIPPFELLYAASDEIAANLGEVLASAWADSLGARVRLRPVERKVALQAVRRLEYDAAFGSWVADYPDPENFLGILKSGSGNNRTGFADPEYDRLLERAASVASAPGTDDAVRLRALARAERYLLERAPIAPLYHGVATLLCRKEIRGIVPNPMNLVLWREVSRGGGP